MDSDFWTSRLAAAKRQFHHHHHHQNLHAASQLDRLNFDEFVDLEEDVRPDIPCPYCYEDFDIGSLCAHLEDEHAYESKPTVCPICSVKVSRDVLSHITLQHGHLFKMQRRRRLRRMAVPSNPGLPLLGRDLREAHLQILLGGGGFRSSTSSLPTTTTTTDPFLSSFVLNFPGSEAEDISRTLASTTEDASLNTTTRARSWNPSFDSTLSNEEREKMVKRASGRACFVQDLVFCTMLEEEGKF